MKTAVFVLVPTLAVLAGCAPTPPVATSPDENLCRASDYQRLVGQHRSTIPAQPAGATWRVTCTSCPVTMDYNPNRLNIFYDEQSGLVRKVRCG